jgi:DNA processing protein
LTVGGVRLPTFRAELAAMGASEWERYVGQADRQLEAAAKHGARVMLFGDPDYPPALLSSAYPVPILFVRGATSVLRNLCGVACVGSRGIREPYADLHRAFAQAAVLEGYAVVSGFALGADTIGHRAARDAGGATVGVMAGGLDRPFPPENRVLWTELLHYPDAAFVSESPFGTRASSMTLRKRNKLIVALSRGVLVSQSSAKGGAMNAYRFALEEHKQVATFASDGSPDTTGNEAIAEDLRGQPVVFGTQSTPAEYQAWLRRFDSWI